MPRPSVGGAGVEKLGFETRITVATRDLGRLVRALTDAGCLVLDAGERIMTEDGPSAEAAVHVAFASDEPLEAFAHGVSA